MAICQEAIMVTLKLAAPLLIVSIVIGLVVAIFQAATQIHEQTIAFTLKLVVVVLFLVVGGSWMMTTLSEYAIGLFELMRSV